jgi:hypothetical protein
MDYFPQHVRKYKMAGCTLEEADWKGRVVFGVKYLLLTEELPSETQGSPLC